MLKNGFFDGFEGEDVKILCSNPRKALPCVNSRLLVSRVSKLVQRPELFSSLLFHAGQAAIKLPSAESSKRAQCTSPGQYAPYIKGIMKTF